MKESLCQLLIPYIHSFNWRTYPVTYYWMKKAQFMVWVRNSHHRPGVGFPLSNHPQDKTTSHLSIRDNPTTTSNKNRALQLQLCCAALIAGLIVLPGLHELVYSSSTRRDVYGARWDPTRIHCWLLSTTFTDQLICEQLHSGTLFRNPSTLLNPG